MLFQFCNVVVVNANVVVIAAVVVVVVAVVDVVVAAAAAVADGHVLRHFSFSEIFFLICLSL